MNAEAYPLKKFDIGWSDLTICTAHVITLYQHLHFLSKTKKLKNLKDMRISWNMPLLVLKISNVGDLIIAPSIKLVVLRSMKINFNNLKTCLHYGILVPQLFKISNFGKLGTSGTPRLFFQDDLKVHFKCFRIIKMHSLAILW